MTQKVETDTARVFKMTEFFTSMFEGGSIVVTFLIVAMVLQFFRSIHDDPGGDERRRAKHFLYALIVLSLYIGLEDRHATRQVCEQGDQSACLDLDIQDFEDQQAAERFGR
jgi:hypothetical protein